MPIHLKGAVCPVTQGRIVEYIEEGRIVCALCLQEKGARLHLITPTNREVNLGSKRALLVSSSSLDTSRSREELLEALKAREQRRVELKKDVDVRDLWELVKDESIPFDNLYLAKLVFGEGAGDDHVSALVRALFEDRFYFRLKDGFFLPNSEERVELIKRQEQEAALREERLNKGAAWLKRLLQGTPSEDPECRDAVLEWLKQTALYGKESPFHDEAKELLNRAGVSDTRDARKVLVAIGVWDEDEHLELIKSGIPTTFSEEELEASASLGRAVPRSKACEDLRDLYTMTIDGPYTRDYDDAISLARSGDNWELWIHIADVASAIEPGSLLDKTAASRASSLYLPRQMIPMLPQDLSQEALSLKEGLERRALSLKVLLNREGEILDYRLMPSLIRVGLQGTYEGINDCMEKDPMLSDMHRIARLLYEKRRERGALDLSLPELMVRFYPEGEIGIELVPQNSPSRFLVAEFMILYNELAARLCRDNSIPILFRNQSPPNEVIPRGEGDVIFYVFQQRRKLNPIQISLSPGLHSGLGAEAYTHATSPIRRYLDLVVQRQMLSFFQGGPLPYSEKDLEEIRMAVEPVVKQLDRLKRNRMRYWVIKYLSRKKDIPFRAIVLDEMKNRYRVILRDFLMTAEIRRENGMLFKPGDEITVSVKKADPWEDVLELGYRP
jgi:exoribonuclease-2